MKLTPFQDVEVSAWFVLFLLFAYLATVCITIQQDRTIEYQKEVIHRLGVCREAQK